MTYWQKFEELRNDFAAKGDRYIVAEKKLSSILGWGDSIELTDMLEAKREFEDAAVRYHDFLSFVRENRISPDQKYEQINA